MEPGPTRDKLTEALAQRNCYPVYIDEDMVRRARPAPPPPSDRAPLRLAATRS